MRLAIDIPWSASNKTLVRRIAAHIGTLNASKLQRRKRGAMLLVIADYTADRIELTWKPATTYTVCQGRKRRKLPVYDYANHAGLVSWLRRLADAEAGGTR